MRSELSDAQSDDSEVRSKVLRTPMHSIVPQFSLTPLQGKSTASHSSTSNNNCYG
ncbi:hypothetical protein RHMOL_Rhmol02G0124200 [Rhododendron molle]|uniref:Uncharacterized protein n=1 Tax=Rhododendron molle TaxID=49168 RepID=A0ACC0PP17_RHOML|nr:hypothetical protein RHMOL_Rhmol02G0124200 [Rhododendron molle]